MAIKIHNGTQFKDISDVKIKNGAAFSDVARVKTKVGGAWQTVWERNTAKTYTKDYAIGSTQIYWGTGGKEDDYKDQLIQGSYNSSLATSRRTLMMFPASTIAADLSGATIVSVQLYLKRVSSSHGNESCALCVKTHNYSSLPSRWDGTDTGNADSGSPSFTRGQAKWITLSNSVAEGFRSGTVKGLCLDADATYSMGHYGRFQKSGTVLRITYTK